jgi:transcription initiation factor TFIIIB Brf1 subunit/transcription initiation factor TFIIB
VTQDEVSEVAEVSTVTIRNRYQGLLEVYEADQMNRVTGQTLD